MPTPRPINSENAKSLFRLSGLPSYLSVLQAMVKIRPDALLQLSGYVCRETKIYSFFLFSSLVICTIRVK